MSRIIEVEVDLESFDDEELISEMKARELDIDKNLMAAIEDIHMYLTRRKPQYAIALIENILRDR